MSRPTPPAATWAGAAATLARRVNRRAAWSAALTHAGRPLLAAAAIALLWRLAGPAGPRMQHPAVVVGLLGAGLLGGLLQAGRATRRAPRVRPEDAAWALDRLAQAGGRGLAAAAARGAGASEAAFARGGATPPPTVRLHPPSGLLPGVGAALLALLAFLAPARDAAVAPAGRGGAGGPSLTAASTEGAEAARAEREATAAERRAAALKRVRSALNLPAEGPLDPQEVAERLARPEARRDAAEAAGTDADLARMLAAPDTAGEAVARVIGHGEDNLEAAARKRREAAGARARLGSPSVPPARREVVQRYLRLIDRGAGR